MIMEIKQAMPHSLVLLMDYFSGELPSSFVGGLVTSTSTCVAIGTISEDDGVASVLVTRSPEGRSNELFKVHAGKLLVPSKNLSLVDTNNHILATMKVCAEEISFEVWVNHPSEPEKIIIEISEK